jgi:dTDP-glucose 4,6-dehydratase
MHKTRTPQRPSAQKHERILITGGAGFIGHHIVEHILDETDWDIVILDRLDISGTLNRLADLPNWEEKRSRVKFVFHDFRAPLNEYVKTRLGDVNYILHLAASTHVDRSIEDPMLFVEDNVVGTTNMLQYARTLPHLRAFINFSTDEVFGPAPKGVQHNKQYARHEIPNNSTRAKGMAHDSSTTLHAVSPAQISTTPSVD